MGKSQKIKRTPSPSRDCVVIVKKSRHSGESRNPVAVLLNNPIFLDARLRGHDELRHSLRRERAGGEGEELRDSSLSFVPLPRIPSREERGNFIFYETIIP